MDDAIKEDLVNSLVLLERNGKLESNMTLANTYLDIAIEAKPVNCAAFLLNWKNLHRNCHGVTDSFELMM